MAKTLAVETLATVVGGTFARIQFTPDLVPADIVGTRIYRQSSEKFDVELGPVFVNFLLADEINRAPAKVQSALLEVMAEQQVSIGGETYPVPDPFLVMATQNPIEQEGVYPLPEAQRDRFLLQDRRGLPDRRRGARDRLPDGRRAAGAAAGARPRRADRACRPRPTQVFVHNALVDYAVRLVLATRAPAEHGMPDVAPLIQYGASPRASLGIVARRPGAGAAARPRLRAAAGRAGHRAGHPAPPAGAQLRRARRRHPGRPHRRPGPGRPCRCRRSRPRQQATPPAGRPVTAGVTGPGSAP